MLVTFDERQCPEISAIPVQEIEGNDDWSIAQPRGSGASAAVMR